MPSDLSTLSNIFKINSEKRQKRDVKDEEIVRKFRANAEKEIEALKIQHQIDIEKGFYQKKQKYIHHTLFFFS